VVAESAHYQPFVPSLGRAGWKHPGSLQAALDKKTVAAVQSCYIPWKGYFDLVNLADEFILYDDRQFTRRDWRSRNRIKTPQGARWLTVPTRVKGRYHQRIDETVVADPQWGERHWKTIVHNYAAAPFFDAYADRFEPLYHDAEEQRLSHINRRLLEAIAGVLGIATKLSWSTDYDLEGDRTPRLIALCRAAGATDYLSGPAARAYLEEDLFREAGIGLAYMSYDGYPVYDQLFPPFDHHVSALDLIFNVGPRAPQYLKSFVQRDAEAA
jgi:hypothetical protein